MTDAALKACGLSRWAGDRGRCRWCDHELSGRQRRWCGDECPKRMLENHYWQDARAAALVRDGHKCRRCPRTVGLAVHHHVEEARGRHNKSGCWHHLSGLLTLCGPCHAAEHDARREALRPNLPPQLALPLLPSWSLECRDKRTGERMSMSEARRRMAAEDAGRAA